tara:strand:+ start:589 stop:750 length:162 start_codon:yes stop_codon:yes gene_type:complete
MPNSGANNFVLVEITPLAVHSLFRPYFSFCDEFAITSFYQVDLEIFYFSHAWH